MSCVARGGIYSVFTSCLSPLSMIIQPLLRWRSGGSVDEFIARLNIEHYREVLASERDPDRRRLVSRLLAEEKTKLAAIEHHAAPAATADEGVSHLNLTYYRKRLANETDLVIRQILIRLIKEEEDRAAPTPASERKTRGEG
jgi:hypothetical protein